jgi:hypothetical protein
VRFVLLLDESLEEVVETDVLVLRVLNSLIELVDDGFVVEEDLEVDESDVLVFKVLDSLIDLPEDDFVDDVDS